MLLRQRKHKWAQIECKTDDNKEAEDHNYFALLECAHKTSCRHHLAPSATKTALPIERADSSDQSFDRQVTISERFKRSGWSTGSKCTKMTNMGLECKQRRNTSLQVPLLISLASIFLILIIAQQAATTTTTSTPTSTTTIPTTTTLNGKTVEQVRAEERRDPLLDRNQQRQRNNHQNHHHYQDNNVIKSTGKCRVER